ncbi:glycosyltransferase [Candidatus Electrothrix sp.]|uniref:glycosyltransferase n=1 Tax=Candidatus Electrothrix sp. TaxID=2170559 RepID=UPI0040576FC0
MNTILLISPEPWQAHTVSKHHYALTLAKQGFTVYFLNPFDNSKQQTETTKIQENLYTITSAQIASGLRYYPALLRNCLERRWLKKLENEIGYTIDTIWLFENSRFFDMRFAGQRLKIYHQVDLNQDFNPEVAASTADICFCTTDFIKERLIPYNPKTYKIHHGLAAVEKPEALTNSQLNRFTSNYPHAVYIGNLDMLYLDAELLADIARQFPQVQFHFVGGYREDGRLRQLAGNLPNANWWGKVKSNLILPILERADIMLVTYQAARYRDQASPHKFMEYLASGKTIVTTYTDEYKNKRHLLEMVDDSQDYLAVFKKVLNNLSYYNSEEKQAERRAFALENTYDKQLDKIFALLQQHQLMTD